MRLIYKERCDVLIDSFSAAGWNIPRPSATMFAWAPIPNPFKQFGSVEFSKLLLSEAQIAVSPGVAFGEHGDDHVRVSLVENRHRIRQAARNLKAFLGNQNRLVEELNKERVVVS
jgi:alanine-synthesizing transaminase